MLRPDISVVKVPGYGGEQHFHVMFKIGEGCITSSRFNLDDALSVLFGVI